MKLFLAAVFALFVGLLVATWMVARQANPILLDEKGRPLNSAAGHHQ